MNPGPRGPELSRLIRPELRETVGFSSNLLVDLTISSRLEAICVADYYMKCYRQNWTQRWIAYVD